MLDRFRIALAQLNPVMGDITGNLARARAARAQAVGADVILFSELFIVGYSPEDLVLKPALQEDARAAVEELARDTGDGGPAVLMGAPWVEDGKLYNAMLLLDGGKVAGKSFKVDLPNYGVFDEKRVFVPGPPPRPLTVRGVQLGVPICEDIWKQDVTACLAETGAEILCVPNGSPFEAGKEDVRLELAKSRVAESGLPLIYLNQLGGQDEVVYDGGSLLVNADGSIAARAPTFTDTLLWAEFDSQTRSLTAHDWPPADQPPAEGTLYRALVRGIRDYIDKNGFGGVLLGLSGGIDSALTLALAVDALGSDRVTAVMMPSRYTSQLSLDGARIQAEKLGVAYHVISIEETYESFVNALTPAFAGKGPDITEENLQSRTRGVMLMALSNKHGRLLLATGNKSEMAVGYATLYGDMCGAYAPLKDVYKTVVYRLSQWRNSVEGEGSWAIPPAVIERPPSAELRDNQTDQDSLPPYDVLDAILAHFIEDEESQAEIAARGYDPETVRRVVRLVLINEFKRRQSAPGPRVTTRAFGRERRYPITSGWR
jgi:NAD+ synthase (glutamine-hydrolysing)